jgi:hypothetical protein
VLLAALSVDVGEIFSEGVEDVVGEGFEEVFSVPFCVADGCT